MVNHLLGLVVRTSSSIAGFLHLLGLGLGRLLFVATIGWGRFIEFIYAFASVM